jgi:hypothetical protein
VKTLTELGDLAGSDKGWRHGYLKIYEEFFESLRDQSITLLEIGVAEGCSIRLWLDYFSKARIYGVDRRIFLGAPKDPRVTYIELSQEDEDLGRRFFTDQFDVIIDDGSHDLAHQLLSCHYLWRSLKPGGYYFVEDLQCERAIRYWEMMPGLRVWKNSSLSVSDSILVMLQKPVRGSS